MSGSEKRRQEIIDKEIGSIGKKVFLVEGEDDVECYKRIFEKQFGIDFETKLLITHTGGKEKLTDILAKEPDWLGLIDRDEWTDDIIRQKERELPNLHILPRFCLESYLIEPNELWKLLPEVQQKKISGGIEELKNQIYAKKTEWLRHGVLWSVVNPLWNGLRTIGFKEYLLKIDNAQDDLIIQEKLREWHNFLDSGKIFSDFQDKLNQADRMTEFELLTIRIHGKQFFEQHVSQALNHLLKGKQVEAKDRKRILFRNMNPPADFEPLFAKISI